MAKKRKNLLPKRIAGVKVPKAVRKGRFGELLASPAGQALIAEAVMAVGAVAGAKKVADNPDARDTLKAAGAEVRDAAAGVGKGATAASGVLAYALGAAARSFAEALQHQGDGASEAGTGGWAGDSDEGSKKKADVLRGGPALTLIGQSSRALATIPVRRTEPRRGLLGPLAAFAARRLAGFAAWRARAAARRARRPPDQVFRGFVQINLIRPR